MRGLFDRALRRALHAAGFDLRRLGPPGTTLRPIDRMLPFLEDLRARGYTPKGIVDVGANKGLWTRCARTVFPKVPVLLVEPQEELRPTLEQLQRELPRTRVEFCALGARSETQVLTIWEDLAGSSLLPSKDPSKLASGEQREIRVLPLHDLLDRFSPRLVPSLIKIDVQGFELEVLKGSESVLDEVDLLIVESSLHPFGGAPILREVIDHMAGRGFEVYDLCGCLRRPLDGALAQVDVVFARRDGKLRSSDAWE